jgi:putative spermidine/putrescine transport system permease protein
MRRGIARPIFITYLWLILIFLYFPFVIMAVLSLQGPRGGPTFPMHGTSTIWYWKLFHPGQLTKYSDVGEFLGDFLGALGRSIALALAVMLISTVLSFMGAMGFRRGFKGSKAIFYLWLLGIIVPGITLSLGLALFFQRMNIPLHWFSTTLLVHVVWTLPFSLVVFLMFFNRFDGALEDAALVLGATPWKTFWHVTFPIMQPAVLTSLLFAFTLSLDEFQRSLLVTGAVQTLPLMIIGSVTTRITPELYALGSITTAGSFLLVAAYLFFMTRSLRKSKALAEQISSGAE